MHEPTTGRPKASTPLTDYWRRVYAHAWRPGLDRVRHVQSLLDSHGIRYVTDGFMADSDRRATTRPAVKHEPDIRILAS
jgi:hypothetical protein